MAKLTKEDKLVLGLVANGAYLGFQHLGAITRLEQAGLIETVKTGFISQVTLRITPAGRLALDGGPHAH